MLKNKKILATLIGAAAMVGMSAAHANASFATSLITTGAAIKDGNVYVWGFRGSAQQGNGIQSIQSNEALTKVEGLSNVQKLTGGAYHLLALDGKGDVYGWGQSGYGETGCFGNYVATPCKVLSNATQIAAGEYFSVALDNNGQVWTWGHNLYGQLGNGVKGTKYNTSTPQAVNLGGETARLIGGAYEGAFAVTTAGHVWAWGDNEASGLGFQGKIYGVQDIVPTPTHVTNLDAYADQITYIAGGNGWGEALLGDGTVIGWGNHAAIGKGIYFSGNEKLEIDLKSPKNNPSSPEPVVIMKDVKVLFARYVGSFALDKSGDLFTWGQTAGSAFPMIYAEVPTYRGVLNGEVKGANGVHSEVVSIGGGKEHLFYQTKDGKVYGIGYNDLYKLDQSKLGGIIDWPGSEVYLP